MRTACCDFPAIIEADEHRIHRFGRPAAQRASDGGLLPLGTACSREHPHPGIVVSLRWIHVFMTAEFARHASHGDILREQIEAR
ncbi:mycothiol transferase [Nocardia sp. NPDC003482]